MSTRHLRSAARQVARVSGPGELVQAIPYLLGFHPADSLVLVGLCDAVVVVTARLDLADADEPGILEHTVAALAGGDVESLIAVAYDGNVAEAGAGAGPSGHAERLADVVEEVAEDYGCSVLDVLLVADGRWWSLRCDAPGCCPPDGRPVPEMPSAFAAAATYSGMVALPDRQALEALLDPAPAAERDLLLPAVVDAQRSAVRAVLDGAGERYERGVKRAIFAAARVSVTPAWAGVDDADVARFAAALAAIPLRDAVWLAVDDRRLDGRPLWRELARRLPTPYDAPALFLYGWAAWRAGEGTLAGIAADRALASDPGYTAADLLQAAVTQGVDPRRFPKLRARSA